MQVQQNEAAASSSPSLQLNNDVLRKKRFLLFIKILFKSLKQSSDVETLDVAKAIVADCTNRNRQGDPNFTPLMDSINCRLRGKVGEYHWRQARVYMQYYVKREARLQNIPRELVPASHPAKRAAV